MGRISRPARRNQRGARLPSPISLALAPNLLSEFLHGPVNDELGLRIRLFRFLFDWFGHDKSPHRTYTQLLALLASECVGGRSSNSHAVVVDSYERGKISAPNITWIGLKSV